MIRRTIGLAIAGLATAAVLAGCSSSPAPEPTATATTSSAPVEAKTLTVFAAASLKDTFTQLADTFEQANPGVTVSLNFAGSADLVTQITEGAPADVFAAADQKNMTKLTDAGLVSATPEIFATNTLQIAVPTGNPAGITSFADLAKPEVKLVICAAQVPCGAATVKIEEATGITLSPVSEENAVTDVLGKVSSGEADAGVVYVTDVAGSKGAVDGIAFPESSGAVNSYPIAPLAASSDPDLAAAFVALVTGAVGQKVLAAAGFGAP